MAKEPSNLAKAFQYLAQGIALRREQAKKSGKSTAALIVSETRGDIRSEQLVIIDAKIKALRSEINDNPERPDVEELKSKLSSLEEKRIRLAEQRDNFYREAEAEKKIGD